MDLILNKLAVIDNFEIIMRKNLDVVGIFIGKPISEKNEFFRFDSDIFTKEKNYFKSYLETIYEDTIISIQDYSEFKFYIFLDSNMLNSSFEKQVKYYKCPDLEIILKGYKKLSHLINYDIYNIIEEFIYFRPKSRDELEKAVKLWIKNKKLALKQYGHISDWDVINITDMSCLFYEYEDFNEDLSRWRVDNVTDMKHMFHECKIFISDLSKWKVDNVTDVAFMFYECKNFTSDLSKWKVDNVTDMAFMFYGCEEFTSDLSEWKVDNVTDTHCMFYRCYHFDSDLSRWRVDNVTNMTCMFYECYHFESDLSNWNINNVKDISYMFYECCIFESDISWNIGEDTDTENMFG